MSGHHNFEQVDGLFYVGYSPLKSHADRATIEVNFIESYKIEERHRQDKEVLLRC